MDSLPPAASRQLPISSRTFPGVSRSSPAIPDVSIIIPARNEESNLGNCLKSLTSQAGVTFEIIVVDDSSTDRTREIAQSFRGVRVIPSEPMPPGWTGKNNAVIAGAKKAGAPWLLFTDADTIHQPGSLARALAEAEREKADLLSYSPEQIVVTFSERAVMPVIFAELAAQYPLHKVRDPKSAVVAANGQYILVRRLAYESIGGHTGAATEILEDVALARSFQSAGFRVYFRYGGEAVRTRMYRNWSQLREGWTKNLALLFPQPERLALKSILLWFAAWVSIYIAGAGAFSRHHVWTLFAVVWLLVYRRIRSAHFSAANNLIAIASGLPVFAYLLMCSKNAYAKGQVSWKGRTYGVDALPESAPAKAPLPKSVPKLERQRLRTEN
jgi:glycosyltransferase involved in cell wall biosynthesis